jgi:hypothetical protein
MATKRSKPAPRIQTRKAPSFEMAAQLCPHQGVAESVAEMFGLIVPEYDAIRAEHTMVLKRMAEAFDGSLNERATAMHFQRIVGALVGSAVGAGRFYSDKVIEAKAATKAADAGDDAPIGLESKAQRVREFAADVAMQAYALLAAAHGSIDAYRDLTGEEWKPYEAQEDAQIEKKAATLQIGARRLTTPAGIERSPLLFVSRHQPLPIQSPEMTVSFLLYKAAAHRFDLIPDPDGDRELSLSNANAADVLAALGVVDPFSDGPWPIDRFHARLVAVRRSRLDHASPAISAIETRSPGRMTLIDCGRPEAYVERKLAELSAFVNAGLEIGATHIGWG